MTNITVRSITADDYQQWVKVYSGYITFCRRSFEQASVNTLWQWLMEQKVFCLVAIVDGQFVGLAHSQQLYSPLNGKLTGYLEDLFVVPEYRGKGVAEQLIEQLKQLGREKNWLFIRWKTRENNYRAKAFHDKIANKTIWHTYQLNL